MSNEENELLKLYESQYTGRLFEKAEPYLLQRNGLFDERDELNKEIERLNNVIDKLEEYLNKIIDTSAECERITCKFVLQYLQELKGSEDNE